MMVAPAEQFCVERLLERGDPARDCGVVQFQPPCCAEDLAGSRDREEDADVIPVHGSGLSFAALRKTKPFSTGTSDKRAAIPQPISNPTGAWQSVPLVAITQPIGTT